MGSSALKEIGVFLDDFQRLDEHFKGWENELDWFSVDRRFILLMYTDHNNFCHR